MYQSLFPAAVGKIILSNTDQTLVVYQMSHIATPRFYTEVGQGIQALTAS